MNQNTVEVNLGEHSYQIDIGNNFLSKEDMEIFTGNKEVCLVYDENVPQPFITEISNILDAISAEFCSVSLEATENKKSYASINSIHNLLIEEGYSRECVLVALGGGIISDASIDPESIANFELFVPKGFGQFISYSYSLDWEQYE